MIATEIVFSNNVDITHLRQQYVKNEEEQKEEYNPFDIKDLYSYNPLYSKLFPMIDTTRNMQLNHKYHLLNLEQVYSISKSNMTSMYSKPIFIKYSPLVDPIHYLIGKYKDDFTKSPLILPGENKEGYVLPKLLDPNNCSYVDCFFNFLCSRLLHQYNFCHGIDYYGTYICTQKKFKINIADDFEYLQDSKYFMGMFQKLYNINHDILKGIHNNRDQSTYSKRPKIGITDSTIEINDCIEIMDEVNGDSFDEDDKMEVVFQENKENNIDNGNDSDSDSDDSSNNSVLTDTTDENMDSDDEDDRKYSNTDNEDDEDDDEEDNEEDDEEEEDEEEDEEEEDVINAYIYNFPVQMICLEKCDGTLDSLLEEESLNEKELNSVFAQIIFTLLSLQKVFSFTHNDLHTNNIVYNKTNLKYIHYKYKTKTYVVPTYGKIYKLIDFGRSIYKFQEHLMCSDSFSKGNDAHSQYNFGPFYNAQKETIEPNMSFDLCRLGCSLYDFFFHDEIPEDHSKCSEIEKAVLRWCTMDNGKNVLYKASGEERFPNFKLYKMIARYVHNNTPEDQLKYTLCTKYMYNATKAKSMKPFQLVDINKLPVLFT